MHLSWARKRQITIAAVVIIVVGAIVAGVIALVSYQEPSCNDGVQNQGEVGPDCGGPCSTLCDSQTREPRVLWEHVFHVADDQYSVIAFLENQNRIAFARNVPYTFTIYSKDNVVLQEVSGTTFIPPNQEFAIFEGRVQLRSEPARITFSLATQDISWQRAPQQQREDRIEITSRSQRNLETEPRVSATFRNTSLDPLGRVEVVAVVYDSDNNAIGASRTFIDDFSPDEQRTATFTWPQPFTTETRTCRQPTDVMVVLDRSGSMNDDQGDPPQPLTEVKDAAAAFLNRLTNKDKAGMVSFATAATLDQQLTSAYQSVVETIQSMSIEEPENEQHTNIAAGINTAREELMSSRSTKDARRAIALLTDGVATRPLQEGNEDYPKEAAYAAASSTREAGIDLYVMGLGDAVKRDFLRQIAGSTDNYFFAPDRTELDAVYDDVATTICEKGPASVRFITRVIPQ